jgi:ABC-type antimicrobial peptide transport system permease subunit
MIGIVCSLVIFLLIRYEYSFDSYHSKKDRIYRIVTERKQDAGKDYDAGTPFPMAGAIRTEYPQVEKAAAFYGNNDNQIDVLDENKNPTDKRFNEVDGISFAEPSFFEIFDFEWLSGSPVTSLTEPDAVVLTQAMAEKYFGDWKKAMGRSLRLGNRDILTVTGILANPPSNSDFPVKLVVSYKTFGERQPDWESSNSNHQCYVLLKDKSLAAPFSTQLAAMATKYKKPPVIDNYFLQPLSTIHFDSRLGNYNKRTVSPGLIRALTLVGIFLLVMACINFINLSTAQVINRAKEAGIRKVLGGYRIQLMLQWITEAFVIVLLAVLGAIGITNLILPVINPILKLPLHLNPLDPVMLLFMLGLLIVVTLFSSFYPAFILSGYRPVIALKSKLINKTEKISVRKGLIVFQFVIAQLLIIGTMIVMMQTNYFQNTSLGFQKDFMITVPVRADSAGRAGTETLRNKLLDQPGVSNVSFAITSPAAERPNWWTTFRFHDATKDEGFDLNLKFADTAYLNTYGLSLVAGRIYQASDTVKEAVVNETLLKKLGIRKPEDAIGKDLLFWDRKIPIVGVVKDFHIASLRDEIVPVALTTNKRAYWKMTVRLQPQHVKESLAGIEKAYTSVYPANVFEYQFLDETIAGFYEQEKKLSSLFKIFSFVGIGISCLGLLGLVSFMAVRRTREIGIRKVLGASVINIIAGFFREFALLTIVAFVIAVPVGWYFMDKWLQDFAYQVPIKWWVFAITGFGALFIALLTVSFQAIRAAIANPVKSLRTE